MKLSTIFKKSKNILFDELLKLQVINVIIFGALALVVGLYVSPIGSPWSLSHQTNDYLQDNALVSASSVVGYFSVRDLLVVMTLSTAIISLLAVTRFKKVYQDQVQSNTVLLRWISVGISGALMLETLAFLTGSRDGVTLIIMDALIIISSYMSYRSEVNNKQKNPSWHAFRISLILSVLAWLVVISNLLATPVLGGVYSLWYVYVALAVALFGFGVTRLIQFKTIKNNFKGKKFFDVERNYWIVFIISRALFVLVLVLGLRD